MILCAWKGVPPRQVSVTSVRSSFPNISRDNLNVTSKCVIKVSLHFRVFFEDLITYY